MRIMSNFFTEEDTRLLNKTISVRERIVDNLIKNDLPTKQGDVLAITTLLESLDKTILGKAKLKLEDASNKNIEQNQQVMKELILNLHRNKTATPNVGNSSPRLPDTISYPIGEKEMLKQIDGVSIKDFQD